MNHLALLKSLGLDDQTSRTYVTLIEYGDLSLSELSRKSRIHRVALYKIVAEMHEDNLIITVPDGKRKRYRASDPGLLEARFIAQQKTFKDSVLQLKKQYNRKNRRPTITFREGAKGIKETFDDLAQALPKDGVYYRYSSKVGNNPETRSDLYFQVRKKKNFGRYVITGEVKGKKKDPDMDRMMKVIPTKTDLFDDDISLVIYEDRVAFVDYTQQMTFTISSERIANFQRKLFMLLFKKL